MQHDNISKFNFVYCNILLVLLPWRSREREGEQDGNRGYAEVPVLIGHIYRTDTAGQNKPWDSDFADN